MTLRCSMLVAALATAVCQGAQAQTIDRLDLDYRSAQARLLERSDAIQGADADVRSKEAQKGSTSTLRRPTVEFEGQMIRYQKTLYLPLGPLADVAQDYAIYDPLRFEIERTSTRPIVTATLPLYSGGQIPAAQAGAAAQLGQSRAERQIVIDNGLLQMTQFYFGQQLLERVRDVRRDALAGLDRHVADALKLEQEGFISRAQRLQAQVARDDAARELEKAQADLASAQVALAGALRAPSGVDPVSPIFVIRQPLRSLSADGVRELVESLGPKFADLANLNSPAHGNGSTAGGAFLSYFVGDTPWAHIDIAGAAWGGIAKDYYKGGASGTAVRTLLHWLRTL